MDDIRLLVMKLALIDARIKTIQPILGYFDTDILIYPSLPDAIDLVEISDETWQLRRTNALDYLDGEIVVHVDTPLSINDIRNNMNLSSVDAWLRLSELGLFDAIDAKIMSLPRSTPIRIMWEKSLEYHRLNPVLVEFLTSIGMTDLEIDAIFTVDTAII